MTKGKHSLFLGGEFALDKTMFWPTCLNFGTISFATSAPTSTGNVFSDWVTGHASSFEQDTPYKTLLSTWHYAVFLQDNYRITPRFTANIGLRWISDTSGPLAEQDGIVQSRPAIHRDPDRSEGTVVRGGCGRRSRHHHDEFHHIAPRVGFAWDPFGDGKTLVRAAAGIFYGTTSGNEWNQPGNGAPFAIRQGFGPLGGANNSGLMKSRISTRPPGISPPPQRAGDLPLIFAPSAPKFFPTASVESIGTKSQYPYIYQFNASVQRQLPCG